MSSPYNLYGYSEQSKKKKPILYSRSKSAFPMNLQREVSLVSKSLMGEGMNFMKPLEIKDKNGRF